MSPIARPRQVQNGHAHAPYTDVAAGAGVDEAADLPVLADDAVIVIAVRNMVLFPGLVVPVPLGTSASIAAAQYAIEMERPVGIVLQNRPDEGAPSPDDLGGVGTLASILRLVRTPDGVHLIVCQGQQRFRPVTYLDDYPFIAARIARIDDPAGPPDDACEALALQLKERAVEILSLLPQVPQELAQTLRGVERPGMLADLVAGYLDIKASEKQVLLEELDLRQRLQRLLVLLRHRREVIQVSREIDQRTKASMGQREREFVLREQMKAIQKELGEEGDGVSAEINDLRCQLDDAGMPDEVAAAAAKELKRLQRMPDSSTEYAMAHTYLDWLVELPWKTPEPEQIDMAQARTVLDADHFGLDEVKKRIIEFLAVRKLNPGGHGPILCLVGPPGVGKTSLGQAIAKSLGRPFARVSLGGVHDEAEIRGHRRTYIGALPGNIIQAVKKSATRGCVVMLDEIDKLGAGQHGDPSAALLEVLDPEQNHCFRDNYLGVSYDLSQVLFVATANVLDTIASPLRDRMEVLRLAGYTQQEKSEIARRYLVARQPAECGLRGDQLSISDSALVAIIRDYTSEAGVRHLERQIGAVCRRVAVRIAEGESGPVSVDAAALAALLGPVRFENDLALRLAVPGVATGLAWTAAGGDILFIETLRTPGSGRLILTGQLGDVMKESAQAALTRIKASAEALQLDAALFEKTDVHMHLPAGAIPKDGPSAGVAMYVALASLFLNRPVRRDVAMTGEISLRGLVLPVGGIKEKLLAALAAGIRTVLLPARNRKDLDEVPDAARQQLAFVFLDNADQAVQAAIEDDKVEASSVIPIHRETSP